MSGGARRGLWLAWLLVLGLIPLLSVQGRTLRRLVYESIGRQGLAWLFLGVSVALAVLLARWLKGRPARAHGLLLAAAAALFLVVPLLLPLVDERLHFLVFGAWGFLSMLLFPLPWALFSVVLVGGLDELLQWWLPDRVGDWRDVGFNVLAGLGGIVLAWPGRR